MEIAFFGIGLMGLPMARRLCEAGHTVHAWNRTREKAEQLKAFGATVFDRPEDAVRGVDAVITMLDNGDVVDAILFGTPVAETLPKGCLVIDMSSIKPAQARAAGKRLNALGVDYLDAPVSGGTIGADAGTLAIMAGGEQAIFDRAVPLLQVMGRPTRVGPQGAGQLSKIANQMIVGITIGAVAEALLMCEKGGADPALVKQAITGGFADSRILQVHGQRMVERDFTARARMTVQLKDMRNALDTAAELDFDAPITALFEQLYADGVSHGMSELDQAGLFVELARRNGMT